MYGQMLRKLREARGRAQAEVARKAEISPAQLARLEMDQRGLYVEDFVKIAEVLGEKPGNLFPNDLGHIGHLKPLIDRLVGLEPEFLGRVEAIVEKIIQLTDHVMTNTRLQVVHESHSGREQRRKMPARVLARLEKNLEEAGSAGNPRKFRFSGVISAEKGIAFAKRAKGSLPEIPRWANQLGASGVFRAAGASMGDVGIFDGDLLFLKPDRNPPGGTLAVCTLDDRVFVKIVKHDRSGHVTQLASKVPGFSPIDIRPGDNLKFYFSVVGMAGHR